MLPSCLRRIMGLKSYQEKCRLNTINGSVWRNKPKFELMLEVAKAIAQSIVNHVSSGWAPTNSGMRTDSLENSNGPVSAVDAAPQQPRRCRKHPPYGPGRAC